MLFNVSVKMADFREKSGKYPLIESQRDNAEMSPSIRENGKKCPRYISAKRGAIPPRAPSIRKKYGKYDFFRFSKAVFGDESVFQEGTLRGNGGAEQIFSSFYRARGRECAEMARSVSGRGVQRG